MSYNNMLHHTKGVIQRCSKIIPREVLRHAAGMVIITQIKGAWFFSGTLGRGVVLKRLEEDQWSMPSAVVVAGAGVGLQWGGHKVDVVIVLNDYAAIDAFTTKGQLSLGGEYGVSVGPVGRDMTAEMRAGDGGFVGCFSYSMSQGLFVGVSLEGSLLLSDSLSNRSFFGKSVKVSHVLGGSEQPKNAKNRVLGEQIGDLLLTIGKNGYMASEAVLPLNSDEYSQSNLDALERAANEDHTCSKPSNVADTDVGQVCVLTRDHTMDETDVNVMAHHILSLAKGAQVRIVAGSLEFGLKGRYKDYVEVDVVDGSCPPKRGRVSKFVLKKVPSQAEDLAVL